MGGYASGYILIIIDIFILLILYINNFIMTGTLIAYYIYFVIFIIVAISFVTDSSVELKKGAATITLLYIPSLLFTGWMAYILKGCVDKQK